MPPFVESHSSNSSSRSRGKPRPRSPPSMYQPPDVGPVKQLPPLKHKFTMSDSEPSLSPPQMKSKHPFSFGSLFGMKRKPKEPSYYMHQLSPVPSPTAPSHTYSSSPYSSASSSPKASSHRYSPSLYPRTPTPSSSKPARILGLTDEDVRVVISRPDTPLPKLGKRPHTSSGLGGSPAFPSASKGKGRRPHTSDGARASAGEPRPVFPSLRPSPSSSSRENLRGPIHRRTRSGGESAELTRNNKQPSDTPSTRHLGKDTAALFPASGIVSSECLSATRSFPRRPQTSEGQGKTSFVLASPEGRGHRVFTRSASARPFFETATPDPRPRPHALSSGEAEMKKAMTEKSGKRFSPEFSASQDSLLLLSSSKNHTTGATVPSAPAKNVRRPHLKDGGEDTQRVLLPSLHQNSRPITSSALHRPPPSALPRRPHTRDGGDRTLSVVSHDSAEDRMFSKGNWQPIPRTGGNGEEPWSGEWNEPDIKEVIMKLRNLR